MKRMKSKLYYGFFGNNGQYKYYCPFCKETIWWSTSWTITDPACEHYNGRAPLHDNYENKYSWKWRLFDEIELIEIEDNDH